MTKRQFLKLIDEMSEYLDKNEGGLCYAYLNKTQIGASFSKFMKFIHKSYHKKGRFCSRYWLGRDTTTDERITILCLLEHSQTHEKYGYKDYLKWEN